MKQASRFDGFSFDPFSLFQNGFAPPEVDVSVREVLQAFVVATVIVVLDEGFDLGFEVTRQEVVFQQDPVLQGLMPTLDLALGLWVIWGTADVIHLPILQPIGQLARDVTGSIVAEQPWLVQNGCLITA